MERWSGVSIAVAAGLAGCLIGLQALAQASASSAGPVPAAMQAGNVYLAGGKVRTDGPVHGDLIGAGGRVIADQPVQGDALLIGGSVDVRADIGDDLRAMGGDVGIEGRVGGELLAAGGSVALTRTAQAMQGARIGGGLVTIDGKVAGALSVTAQRIVLNGEIDGDARLFAERIELGPTARIGGALHHASREMRRADGAVVVGPITQDARAADRDQRDRDSARDRDRDRDDARWGQPWRTSGPSWFGLALSFLGLLAAGAVFVLLFPTFSAQAPERIRGAPWLALATGFGVLVGVPVFSVLLIITVLGIPVGVATLALYPVLLLVGYLCGALFLAGRARQGLHKAGAQSWLGTMGYLALALLILMLLGSLPFVGPLTVFVTTIAGIGACVLDWHRRRQSTPAPSSAATG